MSNITDIILITGIDDCSVSEGEHNNVDKINSYLERMYNGNRLTKVNQLVHGNKSMQCDVFIGAIDSLDHEEFLEFLCGIEWEMPEYVQFMTKCDDCSGFDIYTIKTHTT